MISLLTPDRDAALASVLYLQDAVNGDEQTIPLIHDLLRNQRSKSIRAIELGTGCGIVGIALSRLVASCSVVLTDLPEVEEIVERNMAVAADGASSPKAQFHVLDWDEELPVDICREGVDLILVSDCTYNADSLPALVSTLAKLIQLSAEAIILLAAKRRHESESALFDLLNSAALRELHRSCIKLPSQHGDNDAIEFYVYGQKERHQSLGKA